ncbi:MAG: AAA-like domain-containing protein [Chloroflexota bacterium]
MRKRHFNTAGPIKPEKNYAIPPLCRVDLEEILELIDQEKYFVLHAPRQTGKTSLLRTLMDYLNNAGAYRSLYFNVEMGQAARENVTAAVQSILSELTSRAKYDLNDLYPRSIKDDILQKEGGVAALNQLLTDWAVESDKPLVLFIDEIDSLVGDTLLSVLRQLRAGYDKRPDAFPQSIILCGVRDIRDYRIVASSEKEPVTGGSAFNIKVKSLRLGDFDQDETRQLYRQHTDDTGQVFTEDALERLWTLSQGQPWLVNALGREVTHEMRENRDRTVAITVDMVETAKEQLILRRDTHLDQLLHKLEEPRVQRVIEPLLSGSESPDNVAPDDLKYVRDLGLIKATGKEIAIANPIYQEVIPRELTYVTQLKINHDSAWYVDEQNRFDMHKMLLAFQQFFREHSEHWVERFQYKEAGPQLLMQAFLQRVINGGGQVHREYGQGKKRTDLLVTWPTEDGSAQRFVIELKILYNSLEKTIEEGLPQTWKYMDIGNADEGHLIIFDRSADKPWGEKIWTQTETYQDTEIMVWGM